MGAGPLVRFSATPSRPGRAAGEAPGSRSAAWPSRPPAGAARAIHGAVPRRALGDLLVLELATWVATPLAATLLAELGARVIKIEPIGGEPFRQVKHGVPWLKTVQGKQSLALDLKRSEAREIVHALVRRADLLLHNYRPGVPERLGIDYTTLRRINPRLIYLYGASYGSTGPCARKPAYHPTAGALCGEALAQLGAGGLPAPDRPLSSDDLARQAHRNELANETNPDPNAAVATATAALLALYHRARTGEGQAVETSMLCSNAWALSADYVDHPGRPPREAADAGLHGLCALYRLYATAEGWVFLACPSPPGLGRAVPGPGGARARGRSPLLRRGLAPPPRRRARGAAGIPLGEATRGRVGGGAHRARRGLRARRSRSLCALRLRRALHARERLRHRGGGSGARPLSALRPHRARSRTIRR